MTRNTLQFLTKGLTSDKAKQIVSKVYTSLEDTGVGLEISANAKNIGREYQSLGMDIRASVSELDVNPSLSMVERVSGMAYISQKLNLLSHLSANLCTVRDYNRAIRELNERFCATVWVDKSEG